MACVALALAMSQIFSFDFKDRRVYPEIPHDKSRHDMLRSTTANDGDEALIDDIVEALKEPLDGRYPLLEEFLRHDPRWPEYVRELVQRSIAIGRMLTCKDWPTELEKPKRPADPQKMAAKLDEVLKSGLPLLNRAALQEQRDLLEHCTLEPGPKTNATKFWSLKEALFLMEVVCPATEPTLYSEGMLWTVAANLHEALTSEPATDVDLTHPGRDVLEAYRERKRKEVPVVGS
jgi:hypothetical protein